MGDLQDDLEIRLAAVKAHTRRTKTGKTVVVHDYLTKVHHAYEKLKSSLHHDEESGETTPDNEANERPGTPANIPYPKTYRNERPGTPANIPYPKPGKAPLPAGKPRVGPSVHNEAAEDFEKRKKGMWKDAQGVWHYPRPNKDSKVVLKPERRLNLVTSKAALAAEQIEDAFLSVQLAGMVKESLAKDPAHPANNWVTQGGGLPQYIVHIAKDIHEEHGMPVSQAIAIAVSRVKKWAAGVGGDIKPETQAKAAKAVAEWEKLKGKAHATPNKD